MKKLLSLLLAVVLVFTIVNVMAVAAEKETPDITIDGVKDEAYKAWRTLGPECWQYFDDQRQTTEPVDPNRVVNQLWFDWDDNFVYLYFQAQSTDPLYKPAEGQTTPPDRGQTFFEQVSIYVDTSPSIEYLAPCQTPTVDNPECNHFHCNANAGPAKYYRVMCRVDVAWNNWHNFYRSDEGMFLTFEQFCDRRAGEKGYEDLEAMYMKENGAGEVASFIDYETNTYGFEMKYPRNPEEEYFKLNITTDVPYKEWDEYGPELAYNMAFCQPAWMNHIDMIQVWFEDYIKGDDPADVQAFRRMKEQLPLDIALIDISHRIGVIELNAAYEKMSDESKACLTPEEVEFVTKAFEKIGKLDYIASLGDANGDGLINATDALVALRASVGKTTLDDAAISRAEVNGDGKVDAKDALEMLQYTVGKRKEFTIAKSIDL